MTVIENAVAGKRYVSASTRRVPVFNPATGEQSAELPQKLLLANFLPMAPGRGLRFAGALAPGAKP